MSTPGMWLVVGLIGQGLFASRFIVQWLYSERRRESFIPPAFWYLSIAGGMTLLTYALYRADPVFVMGQAAGIFVYWRNLHLIRRCRKTDGDAYAIVIDENAGHPVR